VVCVCVCRFLILSIIAGMFINLGSRQGYLSAYSIFNPNQRSLLGDLRAEQLEAELRKGQGASIEAADDSNLIDLPQQHVACGELPARMSKAANKPCPCGSGKKYKRCCAVNGRNEGDEWD